MTGDEGELPLGRRTGKSEAAFRTISEVADELDVPQHVLRFWESKFPQVKPLKRGGGRRYYRPEDVALLRRIRDLLYSEGYTIKGVQKLLREGGHKDAAPKAEAAPRAAGEPQPQLGFEPPAEPAAEDAPVPEAQDDDEAEADDEAVPDFMDDGEQGGDEGEEDFIPEPRETVVTAPAQPAPEAGLPAHVRNELKDLLAELEHLRGLLQPRAR